MDSAFVAIKPDPYCRACGGVGILNDGISYSIAKPIVKTFPCVCVTKQLRQLSEIRNVKIKIVYEGEQDEN